jgi:hypothetical protein
MSLSLRCGIVVQVGEDACEIVDGGPARSVAFAAPFPRPRTERVSPGHLVALAESPEIVVWRWYDAVVTGVEGDRVRLWEPAHGSVVAQPRRPELVPPVGARAYLSAGLPGADWWVAGPVVPRAADAWVELDEVARFVAPDPSDT